LSLLQWLRTVMVMTSPREVSTSSLCTFWVVAKAAARHGYSIAYIEADSRITKCLPLLTRYPQLHGTMKHKAADESQFDQHMVTKVACVYMMHT
jgi:hypothetical protein